MLRMVVVVVGMGISRACNKLWEWIHGRYILTLLITGCGGE